MFALFTFVDLLVRIRMEAASGNARNKRWLWVSLTINLGILGYFKCTNSDI